MRFGICSSPDQAEELAQCGFDYVEWPLRSIAELDDSAYAELRKQASKLPVHPEAFNVMLPGSIKVVGPDADPQKLQRYLEHAFLRASELGGGLVVFGSGGSRRVPEGWSQEEALAQFEEACRLTGEQAAAHGLTIALEPLNTGETNLINSVAEGAAVVERVAHPAVRLLSDLYHVGVEGESFADTTTAGPVLAHVHVAVPEDRTIPLPGREGDVLQRYFEALNRGGYNGRVSVEGKWSPDEAARGAAFLREMWAEVASSV